MEFELKTKKVLFKWSEKHIIDNDIIDEQHKWLISLINELYFALAEAKANEKIDSIIEQLTDYIPNYFKKEEEIHNRVNFSKKDEHAVEHEYFKNSLLDFKKRYEENGRYLPNDIMTFLTNWYRNHILVSDFELKPFFDNNTKNIKSRL